MEKINTINNYLFEIIKDINELNNIVSENNRWAKIQVDEDYKAYQVNLLKKAGYFIISGDIVKTDDHKLYLTKDCDESKTDETYEMHYLNVEVDKNKYNYIIEKK